MGDLCLGFLSYLGISLWKIAISKANIVAVRLVESHFWDKHAQFTQLMDISFSMNGPNFGSCDKSRSYILAINMLEQSSDTISYHGNTMGVKYSGKTVEV